MAMGNLQGVSKEITDETVQSVTDLLNGGKVTVGEVSQYFTVPKEVIIQSLTGVSQGQFKNNSYTAEDADKIEKLVRTGVATIGEVANFAGAPVDAIERHLTDIRGYTPADIANAQVGIPKTVALPPIVNPPSTPVTRTPTSTSTSTPTQAPAVAQQMPAMATTQYATGSEIPTGLRGSEMALKGGAMGAIEMLDMLNRAGRSDLAEQYAKGLEQTGAQAETASGFMQPFQQAGQTALQQQLALSGALGPEAFQQAYQESPQIQFLREQGEQGVMRNAAAMGGIGGGNVQKELSRFNQGLASQGLQQQIQNMSGLASQGQQASGTLANIATGLGSQQLQTQVGLGQGLAGQSSMYGLPAAQTIGNLGVNLAGGRTRAGELLANQYGSAASALGNIYSGQGQNLANMLGGQTSAIIDQRNQAALNEARAQQGYGADISNIQSGIGSAIAGVPNVPITTPNYQQQAMNALYSAGTAYDMFKQPQQQNTWTPTNPNQTFTPAQTAAFSQFMMGTPAPTTAGMPITNTIVS